MKIYTWDGIGHEVRNQNKRKMEYGGQRGGVPGGCKDKKQLLEQSQNPAGWIVYAAGLACTRLSLG